LLAIADKQMRAGWPAPSGKICHNPRLFFHVQIRNELKLLNKFMQYTQTRNPSWFHTRGIDDHALGAGHPGDHCVPQLSGIHRASEAKPGNSGHCEISMIIERFFSLNQTYPANLRRSARVFPPPTPGVML
jgi:hypothetical protein